MDEPDHGSDSRGLGLVLSGGAARSLAHLGVAAALADHGIHASAFAGTSGGAIVAAGLASGASPDVLAHEACRLSWRRLARLSFSSRALFAVDRLETFIARLIPAQDFGELAYPLSVIATDVDTGERVVFDEGPLLPALMASCAIPGVFMPVRFGGRLLVDGAVSCNMPVDVMRQRPVQTVLAVDATADAHNLDSSNLLRVMAQAVYLMSRRLTEQDLKGADLVVSPNMPGSRLGSARASTGDHRRRKDRHGIQNGGARRDPSAGDVVAPLETVVGLARRKPCVISCQLPEREKAGPTVSTCP